MQNIRGPEIASTPKLPSRRTGRRLLAWLASLAAGMPLAAVADNVNGAFGPVTDWPLIPIHAALTPDGRVLTYGTNGDGKQTGYFIYDVWDPALGYGPESHLTLSNLTNTDIFCSSQVILPESGDIFIAGGDNWTGTGTTNTGNNNSNLFDPVSNTLSREANMNRARWYSSSTILMDGNVYIQGGTGGGDFPEVRDAFGGFRLLTTASTSGLAVLFPRNFLAPDGRVFGYDTNGRMYYVDPAATGSLVRVGQFSSSNAGWTSSAAMYRPGRILQVGGNSNGAVVIDINSPVPSVTTTDTMTSMPGSTRRQWVSATVLPNGRVLATGGSNRDNRLEYVNNTADIWDPDTGQWTSGAVGELARLYHSSALLLPDASVLVGGGGAPGPLVNTNVEIYYPPYLFDATGAFAPRPQIVSAPFTVQPGTAFQVEMAGEDASRVTLVKTGSVTHSVNMDQRFIELPFEKSGTLLTATLPTLITETPPGFYMLFVLDGSGVPSEARILRLDIPENPVIALDYTPAIGGAGGTPFQLVCAPDEVLVGAHGSTGTYVNQIGPQCVRVDQFGRWIGDPVDGPLTGTTTSGTPFVRTCPRDTAVSGFRGFGSQYVDAIDLECRALTGDGGLAGDGQFTGGFGGAGGTEQGPYACGTGNPAYAFYGRSGGWLDQFGIECRQAPITPISVNSAPSVTNPGGLQSVVGVAVDVAMEATDPDGDPMTFSADGLPDGLGMAADTGLITGVPSLAGTFPVTVTVSDGSAATEVAFTWTIENVAALAITPVAPQPAAETGTPLTFTASAENGINPRYKWLFDDGSPETAYTVEPSIEHVFSAPGVYYVTVTVTDDRGIEAVATFPQVVHLPLTGNRPAVSSNIAVEPQAGGGRVWVVNQDNDSVTAFDAVSNARVAEIGVGPAPRALALAPDGRLWVTNKASASISIIDTATLQVQETIDLPFASQPFGIAFSPVGNAAFVVLEATGQLLRLDGTSGAELGSADVGPRPRHVSITADGSLVMVSRFVTPPQPGESTASVGTQAGGTNTGGEVVVVNASNMAVLETIVLAHSLDADFENQGSGVPNYLGAAAISPDGSQAWVPSKKDNIRRGARRNGANLNFQNTVRAISSRILLADRSEDFPARIDHDDSSVASAAAYDANGNYLFVALETSREVAVVDAHDGFEMFRINVGRAPQGLAVAHDLQRLYVSNFMDRTVDVYDLAPLLDEANWSAPKLATLDTVQTEALGAEVLRGKQLFYDALDTRLARDRYMSCASCHNDGGHDGRTWDLTGFGEGLRNTISLRGRSGGQGLLHWSANFDEVQDFEGQIRALAGGTGLMSNAAFNAGTRSEPLGDPKAGVSADLDALAAYVASLDETAPSPYRNASGNLTATAEEGQAVFESAGCLDCHGGDHFADDSGTLHDIGTLDGDTGQRLGGPVAGLDAPTLRDVWATAPYLHDGSMATLADAITAHAGVALSGANLNRLVQFVLQIGDLAPLAASGESSLWDGTEIPAVPAAGDTGAVELGVKFRTVSDGFVTGLRFYKGTGNSGVHVGSLWSESGALLGRATFVNETATGWQDVRFSEPVAVTAGTVYVASYHAPNGRYAIDVGYFDAAGRTSGPLYFLRDGENGGNGVYRYGATPRFPNQSYQASNYWVDVVFSESASAPVDLTPPAVIDRDPAAGAANVPLSALITAVFDESLDPSTVNGASVQLLDAAGTPVAGSVVYDADSRSVSLAPETALAPSSSYSVRIAGGTGGIADLAGNVMPSDVNWAFSTQDLDTAAPAITDRSPANGADGIALSSDVRVTFSEPMAADSVNAGSIELRTAAGNPVPAAVIYNAATRTARLAPAVDLEPSSAYGVRVKGGAEGVTDLAGNPLAADETWTFTTAAQAACPCTVFGPGDVPATASANDTGSLELGVKFRPLVSGYVTGVRFYKGSANTGTHIGNLWAADGSLLARATFAAETASGWQSVEFAEPVAVLAGTTYVASYFAPDGGYAINANFFGAGVVNGPLEMLSDGAAGGNGVYRYSGSTRFPDQSWNASNYWVDVVFTDSVGPDTVAPFVTGRSPSPGDASVSVNSGVTATFSEAMDAATMSADAVTLRDGAGNPVASSVSYDPGSRTVSLTPSSPLLPSSSYTATLGGGAGGLSDLAGNPLASDVTWSFTTEAVDTTAPVVIARSPAPGETGVSVLTAIAAGFDEGLDEASVNSATVALRDAEGNIVSTDVTYIAASREIRAVPLAALSPSRSYTVTLRGGTAGDRITDLAGNALSSDISWSFTTAEPAGCPCGIWDDTAVPGTPSVSDPNAVELGMKFVASVDGFATGVRFYKGAGNTGTHVGRLWTEDGALLAEVTFTAETATGWQQASFATPVALAADTVYVVSYLAPNGGYAADSGYFSGTSVTNGPLRALQDGESGGNGVYRYGAGGGFPSQTWQASNYWVDVVFRE